jgi:hypothetical protein
MERFRVCAASLLPCALYVCVTLGPTPFTRSHKRILGTWRHFVVPCCCCSVVSFWPVFCFPSNMQTSADRRNCFVRTHTLRQDFNTSHLHSPL